MKFYVNTKELVEAVSVVTKAMPAKASISALEGIYINAYANELYLKCSDLSLQIETFIPAVVEEEGSAILPGRITADIIKKMKGDTIDFSSEGNTFHVKSGRAKGSLQFFNGDEFPVMGKTKENVKLKMKSSIFRKMIKQTAFSSAPPDDGKPILTGVLLEFMSDGMLNMVALDGYRLARRSEKVESSGTDFNVVVPSRALLEISNIITDTDDEFEMSFSSAQIKIKFASTSVVSRLLDGEFINYRNIIPKIFGSHVTVNRQEMLNCIEMASIMAFDSKSNLIKLAFEREVLTASANSERGRIHEETDINLTGKDVTIAFNGKYLIDCLKAIDDEYIGLRLNTSVTPCVIEPSNGDSFYYLVLPVRLFSGDGQ